VGQRISASPNRWCWGARVRAKARRRVRRHPLGRSGGAWRRTLLKIAATGGRWFWTTGWTQTNLLALDNVSSLGSRL